MDRGAFYLLVFLVLRGEVPPRELGLEELGCDVSKILASEVRRDLDPVTRSLLPKAIAQFYENYGYEAAEAPDGLVTMVAFMAQLARNPAPDSLKAQLRFLNTHLLPTLKYAAELCPALQHLYELLLEDAKMIKSILIHVRR